MMFHPMLRRAALAGLTAIVLSGCASTGESARMSAPSSSAGLPADPVPTATSSAMPSGASDAAHNDADVMFAQMMIPHHRQALQMADLAATRAADPQVKKLAQTIKAAQQPEITTMTGWLRTWGAPTGGSGMDHDMPGLMSEPEMAKLKTASGQGFDELFLTGMIAHHQGAIAMAKQESATGADTAAKALAQQIATSQQSEITTMNKILSRQ